MRPSPIAWFSAPPSAPRSTGILILPPILSPSHGPVLEVGAIYTVSSTSACRKRDLGEVPAPAANRAEPSNELADPGNDTLVSASGSD